MIVIQGIQFKMKRFAFLGLLFGIVLLLDFVQAQEEYLVLTKEQEEKLNQFRDRALPILPHEYMKQDDFIIRWLRAQDFNVQAAHRMLTNHIRWRKQNNIDTILKENWDEFDQKYKFNLQGCDKTGRPVAALPIGQWNIREAAFSGNGDKLHRYFIKLMEEAEQITFAMRRTGSNVTHITLILDLDGFSLLTHACLPCIPILQKVVEDIGNHYPEGAHRILLVNSPDIFISFWGTIRLFLTPALFRVMELYRRDQDFRPSLLKEVDPSELTKKYGGDLNSPVDFVRVRERMRTDEPIACYDPIWRSDGHPLEMEMKAKSIIGQTKIYYQDFPGQFSREDYSQEGSREYFWNN